MSQEYKITDTLQKYYDKVFQDGKLVNIHIGMWGMSYTLTEADIKINTKLPETIKLGKKMLIKPAVYNKFKTFEQRVRKYLYSNSFAFPLIAQAHFVLKTKYLEVHTQLDKYREEYLLMVAEFIEKYDGYKQEVLDLYQEHKDIVSVDTLDPYYPSITELQKKFYFDIVSFEISLPTEFNKLNLQDEIHREQANNEAKSQAVESYKEEYDKQLELHTSKLSSFMDEVTSTLRGKVAEHCSVVLSKVKDKEVVSEASIKTLYKQIEQFREANFADDKAVEAELNKLEKLLDGKPNFADDRDAIGLLKQHLSNVVTAAKDVTDVANVRGEYFRKISI